MTPQVKTRDTFYAATLARIHSEAYSDTFRSGFNWLAAQIKTAPQPGRLFDIGCGDGTWLAAAGTMGIPGEGIDISHDFITLVSGLDVKAQVGSAASTAPPSGTTAVTALGEVLAYKPASLAPCAVNVARVLPRGGVFIFDLPGPEMQQRTSASKGTDWQLTARSFISGKTLSRQISIDMQDGREEETHFQHLFTPEEVSGILTGLGYEVEILNSYGPCTLLPGRFAVLARKS